MKYNLVTNPDGAVVVGRGHNNKAPGLLRVYVDDKTGKLGKKMATIKKDPTFQGLIAGHMNKSLDSIVFRFNGNLGGKGGVRPGILIQDATQKMQPSNADEITVTVEPDPAPAPETPAPAA